MNYKLYFPILGLFIGILIFSSCRKENRPAQLNTDTNSIVFIQGETTKYFGIVNTGNAAMDFRIEASESFVETFPNNGILGFNDLAKIKVSINTDGLDYGLHEASIYVTSNGGTQLIKIQIIIPEPTPPKLWWDIDYIKIPSNKDKDFITIRNDGQLTLNYTIGSLQSWMSFSQNSGSLQAGEEQVVWVYVDRSGLSNNLYSGFANILTENAGNARVSIDMEVGVYSVSFFNPTYTDININVPGMGSQIIPVLNRVSYIYNSNPGNLMYQASTKGETVNGQTLGLFISWQDNINLSGEISPIFDLNINEDIFFMSVINYGAHELNKWSINYDTEYQFDEDVTIPNDQQEYYFGYYDALDKTSIYAAIIGTNNDAVWKNGTEFDFPWVLNQSIVLESSLKSSGIISKREFPNSTKQSALLKLKNTTRSKLRSRNSQSILNNK